MLALSGDRKLPNEKPQQDVLDVPPGVPLSLWLSPFCDADQTKVPACSCEGPQSPEARSCRCRSSCVGHVACSGSRANSLVPWVRGLLLEGEHKRAHQSTPHEHQPAAADRRVASDGGTPFKPGSN